MRSKSGTSRILDNLGSETGETMVETLMSILISALALTILATAVATAVNLVTNSRDYFDDLYESETAMVGVGATYVPIEGDLTLEVALDVGADGKPLTTKHVKAYLDAEGQVGFYEGS